MAGVLGRPRDPRWADDVAASLADRGPDGTGCALLGPLSLSVSRFSTIDRSHAAQPMTGFHGRFTIAANCEILNHRELRPDLQRRGRAILRTRGDVEVALAMYAIHGIAGFARLRGPFSIAIWDAPRQELILARDRLGERPLYVAYHSDEFYFASSMAAMAAMGVPVVLDDAAAVQFLVIGTEATTTVARGIRQVRPGDAEIHSLGARSAAHRFARLGVGLERRSEDVGAAFDVALDRVVETDQRVVVALSGGLDSASVLAGALERNVPIEAVTILGSPKDPTKARARRVAQHYEVPQLEATIALPSVLETFELLRDGLDAPAGEPIVLHNHQLHQLAAGIGRVLLAGHGADEVLPGYTRYARVFGAPMAAGTTALEAEYGRWTNALTQAAYFGRCQIDARWLERVASFVHDRFDDCLDRTGGCRATAAQVLDLELFDWWELFALPDENGLTQGVEVRSPFYDSDLIESALSTDPHWRFVGAAPKAPLRRWAQGRIPAKVFDEPKLGFDSGFDYERWMVDNTSAIVEVVGDELAGIVDVSRVAALEGGRAASCSGGPSPSPPGCSRRAAGAGRVPDRSS